jgi:predicted porin
VKLGAGVSQFRNVTINGVTRKQTEFGLGVSAPLGPVTVGAYFAGQKTTNPYATATEVAAKRNGFSLGAKYDLSKRTSITSNFATFTWKDTNGNKVAKGDHFEVLMNHNF